MAVPASVYDTSVWPCFTADCHWALSDAIEGPGDLTNLEATSAEYTINTGALPDGAIGLYHFNGLRKIALNMEAWPARMRAALTSATLCIGDKAVETIEPSKTAGAVHDLEFSLFQGHNFLPLFVLDEDLTVRLDFDEQLDTASVPKKALSAEGLLVRIKKRDVPFFIAGTAQAVLTYDGHQLRIFQTASGTDSVARGDDEVLHAGLLTPERPVRLPSTNAPRRSAFDSSEKMPSAVFGPVDDDEWDQSEDLVSRFKAAVAAGASSGPSCGPPLTPEQEALGWKAVHDDNADFLTLSDALPLYATECQVQKNSTWQPPEDDRPLAAEAHNAMGYTMFGTDSPRDD